MRCTLRANEVRLAPFVPDNEPGVGTTDRNPARIRNEFKRGLGVSD